MGSFNSFEYEESEGEESLLTPRLDKIPQRRWITLKDGIVHDFTICTNNILAPRYTYQQSYPFTHEQYLTGNYRFKKLLQHLNHFQPIDIFCCQETQLDVIEASKSIFEKEGYDYQYKQVTKFQAWNYQPNDNSYWKGHKEGVAIFYKKEMFDLLNVYNFEFNVEAFHDIINAQVEQEIMKRLLYSNSLSSHNVGVCCRLRHKGSNKTVLVCTTHSYFNYNNWVGQTYQMENFLRKISEIKESYDGLIILGDFNAEPDAQSIEFIENGSVRDFGKKSSELIEDDTYNIYKVLKREPRHTIRNMKQSYPSRLKNITKQCHRSQKRKVLDYIFKNEGLEVVSVLEIPEDEYKADFPNSRIPSDHILIGSKVKFVGREDNDDKKKNDKNKGEKMELSQNGDEDDN